MALILHIETATRICSVALARDGALISLRESSLHNVHSSKLTLFIEEAIQEAGIIFSDLDAIAVSKGPGSYTGLRIGVAAAKGLCYALDRPLIAVPTLQGMAEGMPLTPGLSSGGRGEVLCPMLDARRMEVYCAMYDKDMREVRETEAVIVGEDSFAAELGKGIVVFGGEGADKCRPILEHFPNARFIIGFETSSKYMIRIALERFKAGSFENLAYFEPLYLKEFVAGKPRVKGLH